MKPEEAIEILDPYQFLEKLVFKPNTMSHQYYRTMSDIA